MPKIGQDTGVAAAHKTSHENGGSDEISALGLSGALADAQTPSAHKTSHENGGSDEISVAGLSGALADAQTPAAHKTSHENGGSDEISVAGLSGVLADPQTPIGSLIGEGYVSWLGAVYSAVTQGGFSLAINASQMLNYLLYNSTNAQNDQVDYKIWLAAGTYTFKSYFYTGPNQADRTVLIDGSSIGVLNGYSAAPAFNVIGEITGVVISTSGLKTLSFKAATRDPSSVGWYINLCCGVLFRTA